eukprot:UN27591
MAEKSGQVKKVLNVLRRMNPKNIEKDLPRILCLADEDLEDEICQRVDVPHQLQKDTKTGKEFIACEYNRDEDSFRSPWSNEYFPPLKDGLKPLGDLRQFEEQANTIFDHYRDMYFEGGVSSVYVWDLRKTPDRSKKEWFGAAF